jgi:hypothetical protein
MRLTLWILSLSLAGACGFSGSSAQIDASPWWNRQWAHRRQVTVETGAVLPDKGFAGYTAFLSIDTTGWDVQSDCGDLRLMAWSDPTWKELAAHRLGCGADSELRFAIPLAMDASERWSDAYLYYGNASVEAPLEPVTATNVYLWWDNAAADHKADYVHGRMDGWIGTGYTDSLAWNAAGYYTYDTPDDSQASYRRPVDERDVLVEAEWYHTGCYINNMQSGVCVRGMIETGTGAAESSVHYYCSSRGQNPTCNDADQGLYDGDIVKTDNETLAINNPLDPPAIAVNQWRKQALAAFGVGPTNLRFWDANTSWPRLAAPPPAALAISGTDPADYQGRGFSGIMTAQDVARVRNLVIRRYVEPEPVVSIGEEVSQ